MKRRMLVTFPANFKAEKCSGVSNSIIKSKLSYEKKGMWRMSWYDA